ncbi:MAG: ferritin family protein [Thermoplasmata archaeon]|nr:MAG: ferritin family protein [Thermoplasmata archaeon]
MLEMQPAEFDMEEVLSVAIATEWEGYAFYRTLAEKTKSPLGKEMFNRLAEEEVEHVRVLEQVSCAYSDGCVYMDYDTALEYIDCEVDLDEFDEEGATCTETAPIFKKGVDRAGRLNDVDALRIAAETEAEAVNYYREAAETAPNEDAKSFFQRMVEIETGHQKLLEAEYDYYAANGFYFDQREFSLEM